jgi:hypothetical protein
VCHARPLLTFTKLVGLIIKVGVIRYPAARGETLKPQLLSADPV